MELTLAQRKAVTKAQFARWPKATKAQKSVILDSVCGVTGWQRGRAREASPAAVRPGRSGPPRKPREPVRAYDEDAVEPLTRWGAVRDVPTGKRLLPMLPQVLASLERHGHVSVRGPALVAATARAGAARSSVAVCGEAAADLPPCR